MKPHVSIVLCTYNRADLLRRTLASLENLEVDFGYEVIVVDNQSTDHTQAVIAETTGSASLPLRAVTEPRRGISCARNRAIREARGEWIASIDDDEIAHSTWLANLLAAAERTGARCIGGRVQLQLSPERSEALSPVCRNLLGESAGGGQPQPFTRRLTPGNGNLLLHRSVFAAVGPYDETLTEGGEDTDLFRRIRQAGIASWYAPDAVVEHYIPDDRLTESYLLWAAERNGWQIARREFRERGPALFPLVFTTRFVGQILLSFVPRYVLERASRRPRDVLGARCLLRWGRGYLRGGLSLMIPGPFAERHLALRSAPR